MLATKEILDIIVGIADFAVYTKDFVQAAKKEKWLPNPHFVDNKIDGYSPVTSRNMFKRKIKSGASTAFSVVGAAGAVVGDMFGVDINAADIAKHGTSAITSGVHLYKFAAMAKKVKDGGSLHRLLDLLVKLKAGKTGSRATQAALAAIPIPGIGLAGTAIGLTHEAVLAVMKKILVKTAADLHWQAYRELVLLQGHAGSGPAMRIVRELTCLGVGSMHSEQENYAMMREPAGWNVLLYKLAQT